jgi:hypothetical protein
LFEFSFSDWMCGGQKKIRELIWFTCNVAQVFAEDDAQSTLRPSCLLS